MVHIDLLEKITIDATSQMTGDLTHPAVRQHCFKEANAPLTEEQENSLRERFDEEDAAGFQRVKDALSTATLWDLRKRQQQELSNAQSLLALSRYPSLRTSQYNRLAGDVSRIPLFIQFFARASREAFANEGIMVPRRALSDGILAHYEEMGLPYDTSPERVSRLEVGKIALEIVGTFQKGDWDGTENIDGVFRRLKTELEPREAAKFKTYVDPEEARLTYRFMRIPGEDPANSSYGIVQRRRKVADAFGIALFKQSHALVMLDRLDREARVATKAVPYGVEDRDEAAAAAGEAFETAIKIDRHQSVVIIPTSAHYLQLAKAE